VLRIIDTLAMVFAEGVVRAAVCEEDFAGRVSREERRVLLTVCLLEAVIVVIKTIDVLRKTDRIEEISKRDC